MDSTATATVRDADPRQKHTVKKSKKKSKNKKDNGKATEGDKDHVTDVGLSEKLTQQLHISDNHAGHCNGVNGVASNHNQEDGTDATPTLNGHHTENIHAAANKANRHVVTPAQSKSNGSKRVGVEHIGMAENCAANVQSPAAATGLENGYGSASEEQLHGGKKKQAKNGKQSRNGKQQEIHIASTQQSPASKAVAIKNNTKAAPEDDEARSKAASPTTISTSTDSATAAVSNTAKQSIATTIEAAAVATTTTMTNPTTAAKGIAVSEPSPLSLATAVVTVPTPETPLDLSNVHIEYKEYESELQMHDIMRLIQAELSEPYSIYTYRYFIYNWPKLCFLAAHGNEYVGAIVCKLDLHMNVKRGYIAMLAVRKEYRKLKIGTTLVQKAIEAMLADNAAEVVLETEMRNVPALRLYENLGFVRDKRLFRYYLNGVDALRLKLWFR